MSHTIPKARKKQPMLSYESSYRYLLKLIPGCIDGLSETTILHYSTGHFEFSIEERCKYTLIVRIKQVMDQAHHIVDGLSFNVRLCLDAKVAEVISYKDNSRILPVYDYPNENMYHTDEKQQANKVLNECLFFLFHHGLRSKCCATS